MRQVSQTILQGDSSGLPGNCLQAAVASVLDLDLDDVPHFAMFDDWWDRLVQFAADRGYTLVHEPTLTVPQASIAVGPSERGVPHAVVVQDGETVWDPHPSRAGLLSLGYMITFTSLGP